MKIAARLAEIKKAEQHLNNLNSMFYKDVQDLTWTEIRSQTSEMNEQDWAFVKGAYDEDIR